MIFFKKKFVHYFEIEVFFSVIVGKVQKDLSARSISFRTNSADLQISLSAANFYIFTRFEVETSVY